MAAVASCEGPAAAESERRRTVCFAHSSQLLRTALLNTRYENRVSGSRLRVNLPRFFTAILLSPASFFLPSYSPRLCCVQAALVVSLIQAYGLLNKMM